RVDQGAAPESARVLHPPGSRRPPHQTRARTRRHPARLNHRRTPTMHLILHYAAIGFRPYPELGEFVNVGIVAVEAKSRYLRYQLLAPHLTRRIRVCFPELDLSLYRSGLRRLESELAALSIETNLWSDDARQVAKNHPAQIDLFAGSDEGNLFERLTAPQGSPFFYASRGTRLCEDMDLTLAALYDRYVDHRHLLAADYEEKQ